MTNPVPILVDARNIDRILPELLLQFSVPHQLNGFDIETQDDARHAGLDRAMKVDSEGFKGGATKLLFDVNRTVVTGFSLYQDKAYFAYYFNLAHADVENRIDFEVLRPLLQAIKDNGYFVAHKAPYELTMMFNSLKFDLGPKVLCSLQLAVTCFNGDTYDHSDFLKPGLGEGFKRLLPMIQKHFSFYEFGTPMTSEQEEVLSKFIAKESDAEHSYNGFVKSISYSYGLKKLTAKFLNYEQTSFAEVMGDKAHMGQLTGEEVVAYGADDAWTCVHLYHRLMAYLTATNPGAVSTYFTQENPMIHVYSEVWREGVVTNRAKVLEGQAFERKNAAELLREMKAVIRELLPFPAEVHEKLVKYDPKGYGKEGTAQKYRNQVVAWAQSPDSSDDYAQLMQCRTALSKEWAEAMGAKESSGPSITYYQVVRCLMYDLCGCSFQLLEGKVQSDAEAQLRAKERWIKAHPEEENSPVVRLLECYKQLSSTNQVIKLYINNYMNLIDPDTSRVYPVLSSQLATRRMALEAPNLSQLAKNSSIAYVRGYFEPDSEDHVMVSADWSGVELVLAGEESSDPEFFKMFSQRPSGDLHTISTLALLKATEKYADLTEEKLRALPDFKKLRVDVGKGANFGYIYSGALGTVARELNLSSDVMWSMVDAYRTQYAGLEAWRVGTINQTKVDGYTILTDGNIRYRFESTPLWANYMRDKFAQMGQAVQNFGEIAIRKIQTRSGNQSVNARIQGSCATLAKRSILTMRELIKTKGYAAKLKFPVHDELVYSVHKSQAVDFMADLWEVMCIHPTIVKNLKLDCQMAVGKNYLAYDAVKNPKGQIELDEASKLPFLTENRWGKKLTREERQLVVDYLTT